MSNTLGSLVVNLGLDAAQFTTGLTKSEYEAQQFARRMETNFKKVAAFIGTLGIGAAIGKFVHDTVQAASALDDLADSTGSSVEALSRLANQAKISGREFGDFQNALFKLTAGMGGADTESTKVKDSLEALGITAKDPATALNEIALAFDKYADGANKAALARTLFGKTGVEFLGTLKDIAKFQDVVGTVTTEQAAEAERLEQAWRRLRVEGVALRNTVLSLVSPIADLIEQWRKAHEVMGGTAIVDLFSIGVQQGGGLLSSNAEVLKNIEKRIDDITSDTGLEARWAKALGITDYIMGRLKEQREFLRFVRDQEITAKYAGQDFGDQVSRANRKRQAPTVPETGADVAALAAGLKSIDRYVKNEEQLLADREHFLEQYYQDDVISIARYFGERQKALDEAIGLERAAFNERKRLIEEFKPSDKKERIANQELLLEATDKLTAAERKYITESSDNVLARNRAAKDFLRTIEQTSIALQAARGDTVGAGLGAFDLQHRDERTKLITEGRDTVALDQLREILKAQLELNKARDEYGVRADALSIRQERLNLLEQSGSASELEMYRQRSKLAKEYIPILQQQLEVERIRLEALDHSTLAYKQGINELERQKLAIDSLKQSTEALGLSFDKTFTDNLTKAFDDIATGSKSAKDAFKDMAKSIGETILHMVNQDLAKQLYKAIFGGGGGQASGLGGLIASLFGGGAGSSAFVEGSANFVGPIAAAASGTDYAPGGMMKVGEYGTEMMYVPRGAQIIPHDRLLAARSARGGGDINVNVSMPAGSSRQSGAQFGMEVARALTYSNARNG